MARFLIAPLLVLTVFVAPPLRAAPEMATGGTTAAQPAEDPQALIRQCEQKNGDNRFALHRCLLGEYERLQKKTDRLTDQLLSLVGGQRSFGRLKIIQWSNAITKSQSRWQKLVPWDCEWEGHILPSAKGAAIAMDRCGIERAARRVQLLEKRVEAFHNAVKTDSQKEK